MPSAAASASATQAWAILARHARDEVAQLRLQELCRDKDRVSSLVAVHNANPERILLADFSRQRMTSPDTINHLLRLSVARDIPNFIKRLAWGQNNPDDPIVPQRHQKQGDKTTRFNVKPRSSIDMMPTMHLALRAPQNAGLEMLTADGYNALDGIHMEWDRIRRLSESVREGRLKGATGSTIRDIIVVGRGVPVMALRFVYDALLRDESGLDGATKGFQQDSARRKQQPLVHRRIRFVTSVDPIGITSAVTDLDPASTIVISIAINGNEETGAATRTLRAWLLQVFGQKMRSDIVLSKHMFLITGNERMTSVHKPESTFLLPHHSRCEPFTTFTAATLLPLAITFGWSIVKEFLAGAFDMDCHFVETNPRHNLPVLLALVDIWNDAFMGSSGRVITPFTEAFGNFPAFVAAVESQTCGKMADRLTRLGSLSCSAMIMDGGLLGVYDRALYQGGRLVPSELVTCMDTQVASNASAASGLDGVEEVHANQDQLFCALFAHADELAFGTEETGGEFARRPSSPTSFPRTESFTNTVNGVMNNETSDGNRPSTLLICGKCDAFMCGQLVALTEHRAAIKAKLWDLDPFAQDVGTSIRLNRTDDLKEELVKLRSEMATSNKEDQEEEDSVPSAYEVNFATATILEHYANMMRSQRGG